MQTGRLQKLCRKLSWRGQQLAHALVTIKDDALDVVLCTRVIALLGIQVLTLRCHLTLSFNMAFGS